MGGYVWLFCGLALVGALRSLGGEITPPRYGLVDMMKKHVAGVGICGCMTSPLWLENMIQKMRHFEGYFWLLWDSGGGTEGPGWEITSPQCG